MLFMLYKVYDATCNLVYACVCACVVFTCCHVRVNVARDQLIIACAWTRLQAWVRMRAYTVTHVFTNC